MENGNFMIWLIEVWERSFDWIMFYCRDVYVVRFYGKIFKFDKSNDRNYFDVFWQKIKFGVWMLSYCFILF